MEIALVVNPTASKVTPQAIQAVQQRLATRHEIRTVRTGHRGHATELARAALAEGVDAVAVLGGDGTLNEVVDALADSDCALLAVPGGSTNIFCRSIGLSHDPAKVADALGRALAAGEVRPVDLGAVAADGGAERAFLCHTGIGWDAALVELVERRATLKPRLGHLLFVLAGVRTFLGAYDRSVPHLRVEFSDGPTVDDGYFALVLNRHPYTYVGHRPFVVDPGAGPRGGLTVAVLRSMAARHFVTVMAEALRGRGLSPRPWLTIRRVTDNVVVERLTSMPYQVDGDHLGDVDRLELRPGRSVRVVVPLS